METERQLATLDESRLAAGPRRLVSRRDLTRTAAGAALSLSLAPWLSSAALGSHDLPSTTPTPVSGHTSFGRARNIIYLFLNGGPSQYETFDPKPQAPTEIRGTFRPISTSVPGTQFCELLPRTAGIAHQLAVVRSMVTDDPNHESGGYYVNTGYRYLGPNMRSVSPTDWPTLASVIRMLRPAENSPFTSVMLPEPIVANPNVVLPGQNAGFLGSRWDPELFQCDPAAPDFRYENFSPPDDVSYDRQDQRKALLGRLDDLRRNSRSDPSLRLYDYYTAEALRVLSSQSVAKAFHLQEEPAALRDRYGRGKWGQSVLLARRLVEAGVRMVFVNWPRVPGDLSSSNPLWDTHASNDSRMRDVLCPQFDLGFTALLEDLDQRGLLQETLVVTVGEMGRTPQFNPSGGRDHWGNVFSFAMAGAGIRAGTVHGASDRDGAYVQSDRVRPEELTATILHLLGIGHTALFHDQFNRPFRATEGEPVTALLSSS